MEIKEFIQILKNREVLDIKKLQYKHTDIDLHELVEILKTGIFDELPLPDFEGRNVCYIKSMSESSFSTAKILLDNNDTYVQYRAEAIIDEIHSTMAIEDIPAPRDSIRSIISGSSPSNKNEEQIYGLKKGFEYICKTENEITDLNLYKLYQLAIGDYLNEEDKLRSGNHYRHNTVYVMGQKIEHTGLNHKKVPGYMSKLIQFINHKDEINDLVKAAVIHFYIGYIHPYFDGNGRIARLLHQWFLIQKNYEATLFYSFSSHIEKSRKAYYKAFSKTEENAKLLGVLDVTPFIVYFNENVYDHLKSHENRNMSFNIYKEELAKGNITEKERDLWNFVMTHYGTMEFSTKQIEKSFGNAAYATIRSFVLKFEELGLLIGQSYGNKVKYRVKL